MFNDIVEVQSPRSIGCVKCQDCGAEFTDSGTWCKAVQTSKGTATPEYVIVSAVLPKDKCVVCGGSDLAHYQEQENEL